MWKEVFSLMGMKISHVVEKRVAKMLYQLFNDFFTLILTFLEVKSFAAV